MRVQREALLGTLPPEWPEDLLPAIQRRVEGSGTKIVVLDDDPTGTQTVYDVPVLTEWSQASLEAVLAEPGAIVYILTNSRSLPLIQARVMTREIAANLQAASEVTGRGFVVISRSDSTLRGHYPGEVEALAEGLGRRFDGTLIIPFFREGGRLTIHDTHYVAEGDWLAPAAETEYARDATFGYRSSDLRAWVSEKHQGRIRPEDVASVSLVDVRTGGPEAVAATLSRVRDGQVCIVNAVTYRDTEVFVAGLLTAEAAGRRFVYRTAASFVRVRGGLAPRNLLTAADLATTKGKTGGLIIVGSYVKKSTIQMEAASQLPGTVGFELSVEKLLEDDGRGDEIKRLAGLVDGALAAGRDALLYSSRQLVTGQDQESSLRIGQLVSSALVAAVEYISAKPAWLIAKGGITSSDVATKGLQVKRAEVLGQALSGIPIWRTGQESRWPGMIYVVFPGNVGGPDALAEMIRILRGEQLQATPS
jgi:uncharacterized protein YgbK (DUF1537 family)